VLNRTL